MQTKYEAQNTRRYLASESDKRLHDIAYIFIISSIIAVSLIPRPTILIFAIAELAILTYSVFASQSAFATSISFAACITAFLIRTDTSNLPIEYIMIGLIAVAVCFAPIVKTYEKDEFPLLGKYGGVQGIYIYMATLVAAPTGSYVFNYPLTIREAGIIATLCFVLTYVSSGLFYRSIYPGLSRFCKYTSTIIHISNPKVTFYRCLMLFFVGITVRRFLPGSISGKLGQLVILIGLFRIIAIIVLVYMWTEGTLRRTQKLITLLLIATDSILGMSGVFALYSAIGAFKASIFVLTLRKKQFVVWILIILVPIAIFMNVAKSEARLKYPESVGHYSAAKDMLVLSTHAFLHASKTEINQSADRFDHVEELGYMVTNVPKNYGYWNKETYTLLPFLFIPRVIAPFKPIYGLANEFGRQYGLISPWDFGTTVNTPVEVEAWANFGLLGLLGIGIFLGIILILYGKLFNRNYVDGIVLGIISAYLSTAAIESGIVAIFEVIPFTILLIPVVRWVLNNS